MLLKADCDECIAFVSGWTQIVQNHLNGDDLGPAGDDLPSWTLPLEANPSNHDPFQHLPTKFFTALRQYVRW